jgi:hypothetical protein
MLARAMVDSHTGTLTCTESTTGTTGVTTTLTTPSWLSLGQITLPAKRTHAGTAANINVSINASDDGVCSVDRYVLIPLSFGGHAYYHDATATDVISQFDVLADGAILLDNAVDSTDCGGGTMLATSDDRLVVCSEEAASDETTHAAEFLLLHAPQFGLWR